MNRYQVDIILKDLQKKMVVLTGPQQVSKTYLSQQIYPHYHYPLYLN